MGIFNKKRTNNKAKESSVIEGKSKNIFHIPSIFKHSNKKKSKENNKENNVPNNQSRQEQGYYFISYSKSMEISRATSHMNNQKGLVYNPYYNTKTIKVLKNTTNNLPCEDQINNRKRKIKEINLIDPEIKRIHSNQNLKEDCTNKLEEKINNKSLRSNLNEGKKNCLVDINNNDDEYISKKKSTLLNTEKQQNIKIIRNEDSKQTELNHTSTLTQTTIGKPSSTLTYDITSLNLNNESEIKIGNNSNYKDKTKQDEIINFKQNTITSTNLSRNISCNHEKRKRGDRYSIYSLNPSRKSVIFVQEKKFKKDNIKGSKDPNFVKNNKKRTGIITRSCGPVIRDTSIVQGVKGPWKIVETTTLTTGIAISPEAIHKTFGRNNVSHIKPVIFRSPSLPSLKSALSNSKKMISRHQIMSDPLLDEYDSIMKESLPSSFNNNDLSSENSDILSNLSYYYTDDHKVEIINEEKDSKNSLSNDIKKSSPKLIIQNLKNKSLKAVLKHDNKKLSQNNRKRSHRVTISDLKNPSLQSHIQSISTSINTITSTSNININDINNKEKDIQSTNPNINTNSNVSSINSTTNIVNDVNTNANNNISMNKNRSSLINNNKDFKIMETSYLTSNNEKIKNYETSQTSSCNDQQQHKIKVKNNYACDKDISSSYIIEEEHSLSNISFLQDSSQEKIVKKVNLNKEEKRDENYNEEIKPILEMARKRKSSERRKKWPKKLKSNENLGSSIQENIRYENNNYDNSIQNNNQLNQKDLHSFVNSKRNNDNISLHYKSENPNHIKKTQDIDIHQKINEIRDDYEEEEKENISDDSKNIIKNRNINKNKCNKEKENKVKGKEIEEHIEEDDDDNLGEEKNEENIVNATFASIDFNDISGVENHNDSTIILNSPPTEISMNKSIQNNSFYSKGKGKKLPRLIDVPQNCSMEKIYAMDDIDKEKYDESFLTQMDYSYAGISAADYSNQSIHINPTTALPENAIRILTTQSTQRTSTCNYLPKDILESDESFDVSNISNFQIHTCKDSVLSPLIPCAACNNENKWKNKKFTSKLRQHFKKWIFSITNSKHKDNRSTVYTSSATLTIPIYFGDQLASPEDQDRHHHHHHHHRHHSNDSIKIRSDSSSSKSSFHSKKWKSKNSKMLLKDSPTFFFQNKKAKDSLPAQYYPVIKSPIMTNFDNVIVTKKSESEILPIANDINRKNSSIRIKRTSSNSKSISKSSLSITTSANSSDLKSVSSSHKHQKIIIKKSDYNHQNDFDKGKSSSNSQTRIYDENNKHKGLIYYNNNRKILEKDAISNQGSVVNHALENSIELKNHYNDVSVHEGYNETIFSRPITPELQPMELDDNKRYSISISSTISTNSVTINYNSPPPTNPNRKSNNERNSKSFQSLYKDICILGLSLDRIAEKYDTIKFNRKK